MGEYRCTGCGRVHELPDGPRPDCDTCGTLGSLRVAVGSMTEYYRWSAREDLCRIGAHVAESPVHEYTFVTVAQQPASVDGAKPLLAVKVRCGAAHQPMLDAWMGREFPGHAREESLEPSGRVLVRDFLALCDASLLGASYGSERELVLRRSGELLLIERSLREKPVGRGPEAKLLREWRVTPAQLAAFVDVAAKARITELGDVERADTLRATLTAFAPSYRHIKLERGDAGSKSDEAGFLFDGAEYVYQSLRGLYMAATRSVLASFALPPMPRVNSGLETKDAPIFVVTAFGTPGADCRAHRGSSCTGTARSRGDSYSKRPQAATSSTHAGRVGCPLPSSHRWWPQPATPRSMA